MEANEKIVELEAEKEVNKERNNNIGVIIIDNHKKIERLTKEIADLKMSQKWFWQRS